MNSLMRRFFNWAGKKMVTSSQNISDKEYLEYIIHRWKSSPKRIDQLNGDRYYKGDHDILDRKRTASDGKGGQIVISGIPNYRLVDNQFAKMVDQKSTFFLGQQPSTTCENDDVEEILRTVLNDDFYKLLLTVGTESIICGISWLYVYYDAESKLSFRVIPGWQILPIWKDSAQKELDFAIRVYEEPFFNGVTEEIIERVEIFKNDGIEKYVLVNGKLTPDDLYPKRAYLSVEIDGDEKQLNWGKIPLIPFRSNHIGMPLLKRCKSLQDGINSILSTFQNNMEEDYRSTLLVIKNYDGQDLSELRKNIATYGIIKVRSLDGVEGGVESLQVEVNSTNYQVLLEQLRKSLISNCRGYDASELRNGGRDANEMNIKSVYSDITLDSFEMENEFRASLNNLLWFVEKYLGITIGDVEWIFNRDNIVSESSVINDIRNSVGILSEETLIEQHPYVKDVQLEIDRKKKERKENDIYQGAFSENDATNDDSGQEFKK